MKVWERFARAFSGYENAFGQFAVKQKDARGKMGGSAWSERGKPQEEHFRQHLNGTGHGLGIVPLRHDNTLLFAALDIDDYNLDFNALQSKIDELGLPIIICRSKSGGAHCYVFFKTPADADGVRAKLESWSAALGYGGCEVFPKQSYRVNETDMGNWLNLPYYDSRSTERYAMKDGKPLSIEQFLEFVDEKSADPADFGKVKAPAEAVGDDDGWLEGAPICLCHFAAIGGIPEGLRNESMFNMAGYLRKRFPDVWEDKLQPYNVRYSDPPLALTEINALVKSIGRKGYDLKCNGPYCDKKKCRQQKYGCGETANSSGRPQINSITKYEGDPVFWAIDIDGDRIMCDTDTLLMQTKFNKLCMEKINRVPGCINQAKWLQYLDELLANVDIVPVPRDASLSGQFFGLLENFCTMTNRQARSKDELRQNKPWRNEGKVYFKSQALFEYLDEKRFRYGSHHQVWRWLNERNAEKKQITTKQGNIRVWAIDDFDEGPRDEEKEIEYTKEEF